jgi:8-oxo-dGTP diphosphatase
LVVRDGRVLVVHRPRYDDWSLPKGKLEPGESWRDAAVREVEEETGLVCEPGRYLGATAYEQRGVPKEVRWWTMTASGEPWPANEVDAVRWVTAEEASGLLSYGRDRELVERVLA